MMTPSAEGLTCWPTRPSAPRLRPGLSPHPFLLLLSLLTFLACASLSSGEPAAPLLPELPAAVDTVTCGSGSCSPVNPGSIPAVCTQTKTVLIYDNNACFHAVKMFAGYRAADLATASGGEVVLCRHALNLLTMLGYSFVVTTGVPTLEACVREGRMHHPPVEHLLIVHGPTWSRLASDRKIGYHGHRIRRPFREECLMVLSLWGAKRPRVLWPGDLRYYITSFPFPDNSYILQPKPAHCPTSKTYRPVRLPVYGQPYGVLFEKFKVMAWKVNDTHTFSHNGTFWRELQRRVHLVVLDCSDDLAAKLQWGPDYRNRVTCWRDSPLSREFSYTDLLLGATFFLGLGATPLSPTPVDLNYCRTPVLMPPQQHPFAARHAGPREFYPVNSSEDVLRAVDFILANCSVTFKPADPGGGGGGGITKQNSCFAEPPTLDAEMDVRTVAERFGRLLRAKEILCLHRSRTREGALPGHEGR